MVGLCYVLCKVIQESFLLVKFQNSIFFLVFIEFIKIYQKLKEPVSTTKGNIYININLLDDFKLVLRLVEIGLCFN